MNTKIQTLIQLQHDRWCTFTPIPTELKPCTTDKESIKCTECIFHKHPTIRTERFNILSDNYEIQNTNSDSDSI